MNQVSADFEKTSGDLDGWSKSTNPIFFSKDNYTNLHLAISDETEEYVFVSYLSFHTILNLPLEVISYLNHNKKDKTADYGIQVKTSQGNFSLGLNGTIIIDTPITDPIFINIEQGEQESVANFSSFLGEHVSIPINFIPIVFPINIENIPGLNKISLMFVPHVVLNASSSLQARVMDQDLLFTNSEDIFVNTFSVGEDFSSFTSEMRDIYLDISNVTLLVTSLTISIVLETDLGELKQDFNLDLSSINSTEILNPIGDLLLIYLSNTFYLGDLLLTVALDSASFPMLSLLMMLIIFVSFAYWRKKKLA